VVEFQKAQANERASARRSRCRALLLFRPLRGDDLGRDADPESFSSCTVCTCVLVGFLDRLHRSYRCLPMQQPYPDDQHQVSKMVAAGGGEQ